MESQKVHQNNIIKEDEKMKTKNRKRLVTAVLAMTAAVGVMLFTPVKAEAAGKFDPAYYAAAYPDVAAAVGMDANALYTHYVSFGRLEGRLPYDGAEAGELVDGVAGMDTAAAAALPGVVPLQELPHYADLKDSMTDEQFAEVYNNIAPWIPVIQATCEGQGEQVVFVAQMITDALADGDIAYTNATPYFSNAYGFSYYGGADASGCTRTAGLMYEMLGIEWEHGAVSYNGIILHHWSVVTVDGQRYVVDPCMGILVREQTPHVHPYLESIFSLYGIK